MREDKSGYMIVGFLLLVAMYLFDLAVVSFAIWAYGVGWQTWLIAVVPFIVRVIMSLLK